MLNFSDLNTYHILNGDCLAEQLKDYFLSQNLIVFRECLIMGDIDKEPMEAFWKLRANYISNSYGVENQDYYQHTVSEIEKIKSIPDDSEICLWFEDDLFCQVNMWFLLFYIPKFFRGKIYRIFPKLTDVSERWLGFGSASTQNLEEAYYEKVLFSKQDLSLGRNLWLAYQNKNFKLLKSLSQERTACFRFLEEVCQAHIDRYPENTKWGRPEQVLKKIMDTHDAEFDTIFETFSNIEGIYGFGDLQVKEMYDRLRSEE